MRDFELPGRSEALGTRGMAATSHPLATLTALDVLRKGGNAIDAAVAAMALLGVVEPTQTGIGGDCFALLMRRGEGDVDRPQRIGLGTAGRQRSISTNREVSPRSKRKARTRFRFPARSHRGRGSSPITAQWSSAPCFSPPSKRQKRGYPVTERVARDWAKQVGKLRRNKAAADAFLFDGAPPQPGTIHRQPALAAALRSIAAEGPDAFYRGWIARDMVDSLRALGGLHTLDDFASFAPEYVAPISVDYRGYRLWECPPNGQGIVPLLMAKALEGFDLASWPHDSVERYHIMAEVGRQAFADRDCFVGDPRTGMIPVTELLSEKHAEKTRARVSSRRPYCRS